jgi:class 3 adenylate cyclase/tetratricopeptide (TPR) repeat protein
VNCPVCQADNRPERRYCRACGLDFSPVDCARCGFANYAHEDYCGACGVRNETAAAPARVEAERRQLTVMFCDLVGSTALSGNLDPEELREHILAFQRFCAEVVERFDGFVARYMGDGLLVYFGYPRAHEDSAERAVRAGLALLTGVSELRSARFDPQVRVGIATGRVIVGDLLGSGASEERAVVGETPNLAARLQSLAAPDTVVLSSRTRRLVGEAFDLEDLGRHTLKGFDVPVSAWRALAERRTATAAPLGPLVGREVELRMLRDRWEATRRGHGHVVELVGEAGAGKSHLLGHFSAGLDGVVLHHRCRRHKQTVGLHPLQDRIGLAAGLDIADDAALRRQRLRAWVQDWSTDPETDAPAIHALFAVGEGPELSPETLQADLLLTLGRELRAHLRRGSVLLAFEDAQWLDALTTAFLDQELPGAASQRLMVVLTRRADIGARRGATSLPLGPLDDAGSRALVTQLAPELPVQTIREIVDRAGGLPGFLVELTRAAGTGSAVPETLHDSLAAQLDRLGPDRELAQVAAVVGREFSTELLRRMALVELDRRMRALVRAEIVVPLGAGHAFRHPLLQEVAYDSLLKSSRQGYHDRIATVLLEQLPDAAHADPAAVARHLALAGRRWEAATWYDQAAQRANNQGAVPEGMTLVGAGLDLVEPVLDPTDADQAEQVARSLTWLARIGRFKVDVDETRALLDRAWALADRHDLSAVRARIHTEWGNLYFRLGNAEACAASHQRALEEARRAGDKVAEATALGGLSDAYLAAGDTVRCAAAATRCVEVAERHDNVLSVGIYAGLAAWACAWNLDFEQGEALAIRAEGAIARSRHLRSQMSVDNARFLMAMGVLDLDGARHALEELQASPAMAQSFMVGVIHWNDCVLARLIGEPYEDRARAFLGTPQGMGAQRLNARSLILPFEPEQAYHELLSAILEEMQQVFMIGVLSLPIELNYAQLVRRDLSRMDEVLEALEHRFSGGDIPLARLWMQAGAAAAAAWPTPEDPAARAALAEIINRATVHARPLARLLDGLLASELELESEPS